MKQKLMQSKIKIYEKTVKVVIIYNIKLIEQSLPS